MRKVLLIATVLVLACSLAQAEVTRKVLSYKKDDNGNIEIHTRYLLNGVEVPSRYAKEACKDELGNDTTCFIWVTRYSVLNFIKEDGTPMSDKERDDYIEGKLDEFSERVIQKAFLEKQNEQLIAEFDTLDSLVGSEKTIESSTIIVRGKNGTPIKQWEVKDDGTKVESDINVVAEPVVNP